MCSLELDAAALTAGTPLQFFGRFEKWRFACLRGPRGHEAGGDADKNTQRSGHARTAHVGPPRYSLWAGVYSTGYSRERL